MKIVHFSDLHLETPFSWAGATGEAARRRRQGLRDTLLNILELTREVEADALFCGGDLYEHERFTPDTSEFLRDVFGRLDPIPVYIAPGNHDWYGPESIYARVRWSPNVHVFETASLERVRLADGVSLWGAAHRRPANTPNFLEDFRVDGDDVHLALFHGSENSWWSEQGEGKRPHAPFDTHHIEEAGLHHAFLGHFHRPKDAPFHTYPGNPDPLEFGEDGQRGAVVATISSDGVVDRQRHMVAVTTAHDLNLDVTGCPSQQQIRDRLAETIVGLNGVARVTVSGELADTVDFHIDDLNDVLDVFDSAQVRIGEVHAAYDFDVIRQEPTVKGQFVNDVLESDLDADEKQRVLVTGLKALEGRNDLEVAW